MWYFILVPTFQWINDFHPAMYFEQLKHQAQRHSMLPLLHHAQWTRKKMKRDFRPNLVSHVYASSAPVHNTWDKSWTPSHCGWGTSATVSATNTELLLKSYRRYTYDQRMILCMALYPYDSIRSNAKQQKEHPLVRRITFYHLEKGDLMYVWCTLKFIILNRILNTPF